jgi:hypothetical protein
MRTGAAVIRLRSGAEYVTEDAKLTSRRLIFEGRLRVKDLSGERLYPPRQLVVTLGRIRSIDWHEQ